MNKKTLCMILVVPFVVALLGFTNVLLIQNFAEVDISDIKWDYQNQEGFKVRTEGYLLKADPVVPEGLKVSEGNNLIRYTEDNNEIASIENKNGSYYLIAKEEGSVKITCSNEKKTKSKSFNAIIYENGAITINPINQSSGYSITGERHFGEFDISYNNLDESTLEKHHSIIEFNLKQYPDNDQTFYCSDKSPNIDVTFLNNKMTVKVINSGEAYVKVRSKVHDYMETTYNFDVIDNGINVYNYEDLLMCTNKSSKGEIVCLQTSLESKENTFDSNGNYKSNNIRLFGNETKFDFENEVFVFDSTYNTEYIKQLYGEDSKYDDVLSGIHIQKDFYGNGFIINGKELVYPNNGIINPYSGKLEPGKKDLFKGPLTFFSVGNFKAPIVKAFGQDNSLMYIEGDNIVVDDLIIEGTDKFNDKVGNGSSSNNIYNLEYCGTVVDVLGKNVTIKNSEIKNGRTALRVYSSDNFKLDNCLLSTSREFLLKIGCNEYKKIDENKNISINYSDKSFNGTLKDFMNGSDNNNADNLIEEILFKNNSIKGEDTLKTIQKALDYQYYNEDNQIEFGQNITINDSYFYRSGIYSIAFDTYFNGSFLYDGTPRYILDTFEKIMPGIMIKPNNISGTMTPSKLNITGDTRFYDWKDVETIDVSCLIEERLGEFLSSIGLGGGNKIPIDSYFPMKKLLSEQAEKDKLLFIKDNKMHVNTPIAFYGGGNNMSTVVIDNKIQKHITKDVEISILKDALTSSLDDNIINILKKCVNVAAGFNNFKFYLNEEIDESKPYLYGEFPDKKDFINRYKGEKL